MDKFRIGDLIFSWDSPDYKLNNGPYFEKFRTDTSDGLKEIRFKAVMEPLEHFSENELLTTNYSYDIYRIDGERFIIYHWAKNRFAFGYYPERISNDRENIVYMNPKLKSDYVLTTDWFFGLIGFHKVLLNEGKPILHASYIEHEGEAILFTAPSQTGKSTQAGLWSEYAGAKVLNGDRVLLGKKDACWHAYGFPACGSSDICVNRTLPIKAIVILEQGAYNEIKPVSLAEKVRSLMAAIEIYQWDDGELEQAFRLAEAIAGQLTVLKLSCRPDGDAVRTLKEFLEELR